MFSDEAVEVGSSDEMLCDKVKAVNRLLSIELLENWKWVKMRKVQVTRAKR